MKNKFYLFAILLSMLSCSKKESPKPAASTPVSGKIYSSMFTAQTAIASKSDFHFQNFKSEDLFAIYLSSNKADDCSADIKNFSVRLSVPKKVGRYTEGEVYVLIDDPNSDEGALFPSDSVIEITSITADKVTGTVDAKFDSNFIKGSFVANICH
jgi:hypothetical protein